MPRLTLLLSVVGVSLLPATHVTAQEARWGRPAMVRGIPMIRWVLALALIPCLLCAQELPGTTTRAAWASGGAGFGSNDVATFLALAYQYNHTVVALNWSGTRPASGGAGRTNHHVALMIGRSLTRGLVVQSLSVGVGPVWGTQEFRAYGVDGVGIPVVWQIAVVPFGNGIGLGATGYINLNLHRVFGGLMFTVQLGKLQ